MLGVEEAGLRSRFLREARIQGQLEHPSVVPVYDLAVEQGVPLVQPIVFVTGCLVLWGTSIVLGPFFLQPLFAAVAAAAWAGNTQGRDRVVALAFGVLAVLVPAALELTGVVPATTRAVDGLITIDSPAYPARASTLYLLTGANLVVVLLAAAIVGRTRDELRREASRSRWVAWQLRQLVSMAGEAQPEHGRS